MKIGFIGLGNMGSGMAQNLLRYCQANESGGQHELLVFDLNKAAVEPLLKQGATQATSLKQMAQEVNLVFTSLPSSKEVNLVAKGSEGLLENLTDGATWVETSTNELSEWKDLQTIAPEFIEMIDAPVTGGAEGAAAGTLTMLMGVEQRSLDNLAPILASFTSKAVRMGPSGAGYVTKLCQLHLNYLVAQGIGETLMLGKKAELDLETLHGVLKTSCAQSYVVDSYIPKVLDGSYDPSFTLGLATKDMRLISELGQHLGTELPLGDQVYQHYQHALESYGADEPHLKIVKLIEDKAGVLLR